MRTRASLFLLAAGAAAFGVVPHAAAAAFTPDAPAAEASTAGALTPDAIFSRAKAAWRSRVDAPFVTYGLRERYTWRNRVHDNWWQGYFRSADDALVLRRVVVAADEAARLRGTAIGIDYHIHNGSARVDSLETNADADAFPILDPLVDPTASFGLTRGAAQHVSLEAPRAFGASPSPSPTPRTFSQRLSLLAGPSPVPGASDPPLRELAHIEAVARDYRIALVGTERVRDVDAYHLSLVPIREPNRNRLRDLWVGTGDYATVKLATAGLFNGRPYDEALWTVTYVQMDGRPYVQQIKTDETLRFGIDRFVSGLEYDFVGYAFPASIDPLEFRSLR